LDQSVFMKEVVVIFSHLPWDFPVDYVQQTARQLTKRAQVVVFNPRIPFSFWKFLFNRKAKEEYFRYLKKGEDEGILRFFPLGILPFQRVKLIEKINVYFGLLLFKFYYLFHFGRIKPIVWTFSSELVDLIPEKRKILVYDRVDQIASLDPGENRWMKQQDKRLLKLADYVFVNSPYALRFVKKYNQNSFLVSCGCAVDLFQQRKLKPPQELKEVKKPIIGLVGSLDFRLDFQILYPLIKKRKDWRFVFIGTQLSHDPAQFKATDLFLWLEKLQKLPNAYFLGKKPKGRLPHFLFVFDVCLIPYDVSLEFVQGCNPMKLYEYLALGKPVVSTPIEAVKVFSPIVKIANTASGFEEAIEEFLKEGDNLKELYEANEVPKYDKKEQKKRKKIAQENSWEKKVERMWGVVSSE